MRAAEVLVSFWRNRGVTRRFAWREIVGRYRGSYLGLLWAFVTPLATVAIYSFVFGAIFGARWTTGTGASVPAGFAVPMFAGLLVYMFVSECATKAPGLVVANANFVKRVVFPLEVLCSASVAASLFHAGVGLAILVAWAAALGVLPTIHFLWLPVIWLPLVAFALGLSLALAALGVFVRDIAQAIGLAMIALLFTAPIMFPIEALPQTYVWLAYMNPLTSFVEMTRGAVILARAPEPQMLMLAGLIGAAAFAAGVYAFARARHAFADVI